MPQPSPPSVPTLSQRLAHDNRRVGRALDRLPTLVHEIVAAWDRGDQRSLSELSQKLLAAAASQSSLAALAARLDREIQSRERRPVQRSLLALVGQVGALRRRGMVPAVTLPANRGAGC